MKIDINDHRKLFAVKEEFHTAFPNYRIEFFEKPSKSGSAPSEKIVKHASATLGQCRLAHNKGMISIVSGMTVGEVEQNFRDVYELSIQVQKKSDKTGQWQKAAPHLPDESDKNHGVALTMVMEVAAHKIYF